jgi:indolepyruvate ferredoxin oxidoreductase beta subunit
VESHVRFGNQIYSPLISPGTADYLVAFHAGEGRRMSAYLKKAGTNLAAFLDGPSTRPSDKRFVNTYFLGMLSAYLPVSEEAWKNALTGKLKRSIPENLKAFDEGKDAGRVTCCQ